MFSYKQVVHMLMLLGLIRITSLSDADGARLKRRNTQSFMLGNTQQVLKSILRGGGGLLVFDIGGPRKGAHNK